MDRKLIARGIVLGAFLAVFGFALGTLAGAIFFVPPGSGLAGPAIAIGCGVMGAAGGVGICLVLVSHLDSRQLGPAIWVALLLALGAVALLFSGVARRPPVAPVPEGGGEVPGAGSSLLPSDS
jgi:hypothetical protein